MGNNISVNSSKTVMKDESTIIEKTVKYDKDGTPEKIVFRLIENGQSKR